MRRCARAGSTARRWLIARLRRISVLGQAARQDIEHGAMAFLGRVGRCSDVGYRLLWKSRAGIV
jgi:hypothetical protein